MSALTGSAFGARHGEQLQCWLDYTTRTEMVRAERVAPSTVLCIAKFVLNVSKRTDRTCC